MTDGSLIDRGRIDRSLIDGSLIDGSLIDRSVADPPTHELSTEGTDRAAPDLGALTTPDMIARHLEQEARAIQAVAAATPALATVVDAVAARFAAGGRLIYAGAGTGGRLARLDAIECGPTFDIAPERLFAVVAGGTTALLEPAEDREDDAPAATVDVAGLALTAQDSVIGVSASGRTPYTVEFVRAARRAGALTVGVACNTGSALAASADLAVELATGPEIIAGSTRLKAGTAQKVVLNALSTLIMVRTGRTYANLMVEVQVTNEKLRHRARRIVAQGAEVEDHVAATALEDADGEVKTALVALRAGVSPAVARQLLRASDGRVREAIAALAVSP